MRTKSLALLVLALGCGLVASIGITQVMAKRNADPAAPSGETKTILRAMKDIGLGDFLTAQVLLLEEWPKDRVPDGALTKIEDAEGRRARTKLYAGEPILENKLFRKGVNIGSDDLIPKGYRVVSVKVDSTSAVSNLLLPGSRVDVLVFLTKDPGRGIHNTGTRTVLEDIKVFAVNEVVSLESKDQETGKSIAAKTVSLLVTPDQGAKLTLASEMGKIKLVMRNPDEDKQAMAQATPEGLFGKADGTDREKESLVEKPAGPPAKKRSFLDVLNAARAELAAAKPPAIWTMRIVKPGAIDDITMQAESDEPGLAQGFAFWKSQSTKSLGASGGGKEKATAAEAGAGGGQQPAPNQEPAAEGEPKDAAK